MINRFEATGIFISISLMALALFLLNIESATTELNQSTGQETATVVLADNSITAGVNDRGVVTKLIIDDVVIGDGDEVAEGDTVAVHYIGTLKNGQEFDNSYVRTTPFEFTVGEGRVIAGWEQGVIGMKVGGQRILVIPADLAYGNRQIGPIPANSTLVFAIELLEIK